MDTVCTDAHKNQRKAANLELEFQVVVSKQPLEEQVL